MAIKVGINGYGRIGRNILRALYESGRSNEIKIVAINDLGDAATNAHLTRHDTTHGKFPGTVDVEGDDLVINGDRIRVFADDDPAKHRLEQRGCRHGAGVHRVVRQQGQGFGASPGRRQESHHFSARRRGRGCHRGIWRESQNPQIHAHRDLQRLLYHQLPGTAGQGAA